MLSKLYTGFMYLTIAIFVSCGHKRTTLQRKQISQSNPDVNRNVPALLKTDTLQYIHFEGNFDYWSCVFLNSKKDTVSLVTDTIIPSNFKNRLLEVKYFLDTLYEAGDNDRKYASQRMSQFKLLKGKPFSAPITEQQVLLDVENIPEVSSGADQVGIVERPTVDKTYYVVETGTHNENNYSRFATFRVYIYPHYEIRVYDPEKDTDISLGQWRNK